MHKFSDLPSEIRHEIFSWSIAGDYKTTLYLGQVCRLWKHEAEYAKRKYYSECEHSQDVPYDVHPLLADYTYKIAADLATQVRVIAAEQVVLEQSATHPPTKELFFRISYDDFEETLSDITIRSSSRRWVTVLDVFEQLNEGLKASPVTAYRKEALLGLRRIEIVTQVDETDPYELVNCYPEIATFCGFEELRRGADGIMLLVTNELEVDKKESVRYGGRKVMKQARERNEEFRKQTRYIHACHSFRGYRPPDHERGRVPLSDTLYGHYIDAYHESINWNPGWGH